MVTTDKTSPPKLTSINNNLIAGKGAIISLTFDKPIKAGSGSIRISNDSDIHTISMTDSQVSIKNQTLTITPKDLLPNSHYSITISATAIKDSAGNNYAGTTDLNGFGFNTIDTNAPTLKSVTPANKATEVKTQADIVLTFSEVVKAGTGNIIVSNGTDSRTIAITDKSQVTFDGNKVIINPTENLQSDSHYNVKIEKTAIQDSSANKYAGIKNNSSLNFFTMADHVAPKLLSIEPSKGGKLVAVDSNITLTFNEPIQAGTGNILVSNGFDNRTIPITDSTVTIAGNKLTLNPATDLTGGGVYNVRLDAGAIEDKADNAFAGIKSTATFNFSPVDKIPPVLLSTKPADDSLNVAPSRNLVLTFNENVKAGSGNIEINNGVTTTKIAVTDKSQVLINKNVVTINPKTDFATDSHYNVQFAAGVIKDSAGNAFAGINDAATFNFSTVDRLPPVLLSTTPTDDALNVAKDSHLVLTFNENVKANIGNIEIHTGTTTTKIAINDKSQVTVNKNVVTINPKNDLIGGSDYSVQLAAGAIKDSVGNTFAGISDTAAFTFSTVDTDTPKLVSSTPADNNLNVTKSSNIVLTFDENIVAGHGNFVISNGSDVRIISVADTLISGKVVTINPPSDLNPGKTYHVTAPKGIVKDAAGNDYAGISNTTTLNFTTKTTASSGYAIDGYLAFSTVFADANGNGILDSGEANTKTNIEGNFILNNAVGSLVTIGGTDLTTGLAFKGTLKAPAGSTVITPLTTVVEGIIKSGKSIDEAQAAVIKAFDLPSAIDLFTDDPIASAKAAVTPAEKTAAANVLAKTATVVNFLVTTTEVLKGAGGDNVTNEKSNSAVIASLVSEISKNTDGVIDFSNQTLVKTMLKNSATTISNNTTGETKNFEAKIAKVADTVANVIKDSTDNVNAAVLSAGGDSTKLLTDIGSVSKFAQGSASDSLQQAAKTLNPTGTASTTELDKLTTSLTGDAAKSSIAGNLATSVTNPTTAVVTNPTISSTSSSTSSLTSGTTADTTPPTLAISSTSNTVKIGDTTAVTFTFSEPPVEFSESDIEITEGQLTDFTVNASDAKVYSATFSPYSTSTSAAHIKVASSTYTDVAGNKGKADSALVINLDSTAQAAAIKASNAAQAAIDLAVATLTAAKQALTDSDKIPPTLTISSDAESVKVGETATITFKFSEQPFNFFVDSDVVVIGGTLSKMSNSGLIRKVTFTPTTEISSTASISVAEGSYTDEAENNGGSGMTTISVDTISPKIAITSSLSTVKFGETSVVNFVFNKTPIGFIASDDIVTTGGTLTDLAASNDKSYTATFTPTANATSDAKITVAAGNYLDSVGNKNLISSATIIADTVVPTVSSSVPADNAVLSNPPSSIVLTFSETVVAGSGVITMTNVTNGNSVSATSSAIANSTTITITPTGLKNGYDYTLTIPAGFVTDTAGNQFNSSTLHFTVENGSLTSPAITETTGNDILDGNQGDIIEDTSVTYSAEEGNDIYVLDLTTAANVEIDGFGSGDQLVFNVTTIASGLTEADAFYSVSDDGTDIQLIAVTDDGNVQVVTLVGLSSNVNPSSVGSNIDSISELNTFLTSIGASIDFI